MSDRGTFKKQLARFAENLEGENWQQELACLEDSFLPMGQREKTLQGLRENVLTENHVSKGNLDMFPLFLGLGEREDISTPQLL